MSRWAHWSPRYAVDRIRLSIFEARHPGAPWLTPDAVAFLESWLRPDHAGIEYGSGRSTLWFARRVGHLISIEHNPAWFDKIKADLKQHGAANVALLFCDANTEDYLQPILDLAERSIDFALVDGASARRDACALALLDKLRPGGVLIIDDSHRYFSYETRSPLALGPGKAPLSEVWKRVEERTRTWKQTLTTSGVTDTLILQCPGKE